MAGLYGGEWVSNGSLQKGSMPNILGCVEHHCKLARILKEAHKSIAVAWLDLANAYGSIHHSLIRFSLKHYHAPSQFSSIVGHLYSVLSAVITTEDWSTSSIPLNIIGINQGDPLLVVIFNTVINTLVDTGTKCTTHSIPSTCSSMLMTLHWWEIHQQPANNH